MTSRFRRNPGQACFNNYLCLSRKPSVKYLALWLSQPQRLPTPGLNPLCGLLAWSCMCEISKKHNTAAPTSLCVSCRLGERDGGLLASSYFKGSGFQKAATCFPCTHTNTARHGRKVCLAHNGVVMLMECFFFKAKGGHWMLELDIQKCSMHMMKWT